MVDQSFCGIRGFLIAATFLVVAIGAKGATIVLPGKGVDDDKMGSDEVRAASELSHIWMVGTGKAAEVRREDVLPSPHETGPWFFLGETALGRSTAPLPAGLDSDGFRRLTLQSDRVIVRGATSFATVLGTDWYAQQAMSVRWFIPGPLGEVVPSLRNWKPPSLNRVITPAFFSRALGGLDGEKKMAKWDVADGGEWARRNGLHERLPHDHALAEIFPAQLFDSHQEWFPWLDGQRYRPEAVSDHNWQPNLALPDAAAHAADEANGFFDRDPEATGFSLSINDSIRFDQSEATMRARGPLRWFRNRPDYSDLVFGFMNRVADMVAQRHPDKLLSAYAYYWCENTPTFSVRSNIVPWLTADRSQWYDPSFRAEDRALIERWCRSGAKVVGLYDYLYGAPFLVPRVTTQLTADSIRFSARAGVKAYFAETGPNWALDGPKLWVAAHLLWDPRLRLDDLLSDYYSHFWGEVALPMRQFYEGCEAAWLEQPRPGWWIKYYQDEAQTELFPSDLCRKLRAYLREAQADAGDATVKARLEMVSSAFAVTENFVAFCEARTVLSRVVADSAISRERKKSLLADYLQKRERLASVYKQAASDGAIAQFDLWSSYLRDDPAAEMDPKAQRDAGLKDEEWRTLRAPEKLNDQTFTWSAAPWLGRGEPVERRNIEVSVDGKGQRTVTYRHCKSERLQQWTAAFPGENYEVSVYVRGNVSPGNQTFIVLNWKDSANHYIGRAAADRMPDGKWMSGKHLLAAGRAPMNAAYVGVGVFTSNQGSQDFVSFSNLRLKFDDGPH